MGVPGLNLDVPGQVFKLKTPFFRWFCMQATQHCANAPTLTKHWQERQKSRFCKFHKLCAQAPKPHQIDLGACHTKLSTKIVLQTGLWSCRASFWKGLGLSWVARGRLLNALERLLALLGRFLGASEALLGISWLVCGASWMPFWRPGSAGASILGGFGACFVGLWRTPGACFECFLLRHAFRYIVLRLVQSPSFCI